MGRTPAALRRHRRRGDERPRAGGAADSGRAGQRLATARNRPTPSGCARPASSPTSGHDAGQPARPGAEVVVSTAIPDDNPELAARARAGARDPPRRAARRALAAEALDRGRGHARQDHHRVHGRPRPASSCGREPAYLIGGELRSTRDRTRPGARATGSWSRPTSPIARSSSCARDVAVVTNVELDHHATYALPRRARARRSRDSPSRPSGARGVGPGVELPAAAGDVSSASTSASCAPSVELLRAGLALRGRGHAVELQRARAPQRAERARRAGGLPRGGRGAPRGGARRSRASAARAALRVARAAPSRGARVYDDYAHHPTEVRATLEAARTLGAARGSWPCFQPHLYSRTQHARPRLRPRAGAGGRRRGARRLPGARARRGLPRRDGLAGRRRRPPTRRAGARSAGCPTLDGRRARAARASCARATCC